MKLSSLLGPALAASAVSALPPSERRQQRPLQAAEPEQFLVELAPGRTRWVTEEGKWALKRQGVNFMDITEHGASPAAADATPRTTVTFPARPAHPEAVRALLPKLSTEHMRRHLEKFTSFYTRYYKSSSGAESAAWLHQTVNATLAQSPANRSARVELFEHPWGQPSVIATIPGKSNRTVVVGAHQDSINQFLPALLPAPGADDDGSGTVTILEALRVLLADPAGPFVNGSAANTVEFHWYSAEEGGLLGSQAVFGAYAAAGRDVRAMLQQDMTGYGDLSLRQHEAQIADSPPATCAAPRTRTSRSAWAW